MDLNHYYSLDQLLATFNRASALAKDDTATAVGLCAVIRDITDAARLAATRDLQRYDHRSLYEFCAALDRVTRSPVQE